jgi:hypothetical protein
LDKRTVFHTSDFTIMHCHPLSLSVTIVLTLVFTIGLAKTAPRQLDPQPKVFISSLLPLVGRMYNYYLLLLMWFPFLATEPSSCDLCMHTSRAGSVVTRTLLFHTYYSCAGSVMGSCTHNHTTYLVCSHGNQHIYFNPTYRPQEQWLEIKSIRNPGNLVNHTQVFSPDNQCPCSLMHSSHRPK